MKSIGLICLIGLMGGMAEASPQTSDADLKLAQLPALTSDENTVDCHGLRFVLPSTVANVVIANSGEVDASGVTSFESFVSNSRLIVTGSVFKNGDASAIFSAVGASTGGVSGNILLWLPADSITGAVTIRTTSDNYTPFVNLSGNQIAAVDLSPTSLYMNAGGVSGYAVSGLDLSGNASLSAITAGNGTSTGITAWNGMPVSFNGDALTNASEDALLDAGVAAETAVPGQGGNLDVSGGTNAVPDETGADDIAVLVGTGWTITSN